MQPPSNPFQSFTWLNEFIATVSDITYQNHVGFSCEPFVTQPNPVNGARVALRGTSTGNCTNGWYWLGFYYKLWKAENPNNRALPWFGCSFVDEFTICIIVDAIEARDAQANNHRLHKYLLDNEYAGVPNKPPIIHGTDQKPFGCQSNGIPTETLWYRFDDYMTNVQGQSNFSLSDWILCSSRTQEDNLREFFKTVNANYLALHI